MFRMVAKGFFGAEALKWRRYYLFPFFAAEELIIPLLEYTITKLEGSKLMPPRAQGTPQSCP